MSCCGGNNSSSSQITGGGVASSPLDAATADSSPASVESGLKWLEDSRFCPRCFWFWVVVLVAVFALMRRK